VAYAQRDYFTLHVKTLGEYVNAHEEWATIQTSGLGNMDTENKLDA
jgi:hypothetical protein